MSGSRSPLQSIVIAGDGQVGVLAAIALKRALPGARVTVIGMPREDASFAEFAPTALPFANTLHDRLGLSEELLVARAGASHRLVTRYFGWSAAHQHGVLEYGEKANAVHSAGFGSDWGGGSRSAADAPDRSSLAEALASSGRFAPPLPDGSGLPAEVDYALRWNVPAYHAVLVQAARSMGIEHVSASGLAVEPDGASGVASLVSQSGDRFSANLYLDCSGAGALLARQIPGYTAQDWSAFLKTRRVFVAPVGGPMLALEDRLTLTRAGWLSEVAGRDGLQSLLGTGESIGESAVLAALGAAPVADLAVQPSRIAQCWQGNVIALGDAAAQFEPLGGLNLDLAHRQLDLLLEMLPALPFIDVERAEFNRRAGLMMDGVRDVLALHYAARLAAEIFASTTPDPVMSQIDQFTRRGRLPFREESPFLPQETMALLHALGFAAGLPPQHSARAPAEALAAQRAFVARRDTALAQAPPYQQWIAALLQSAA